VDLDHLIDYYASYRFSLNLKHMYRALEEVRLKRIYLVLHSYELVICSWAAVLLFSPGMVWKGAAIGLTQHLIFDNLTNPINTKGYFLLYRLMKRFRTGPIISRKGIDKRRRGGLWRL